MTKKRVAIIGAGPSGLPAIRHALLNGLDPVCFEATGDVGGLWNYKEDSKDGASVMKSTVINSSKEMSSYSDFPPPANVPNFMHNRRMKEYFQDYKAHFGLDKYIRFHCNVTEVRRTDDHAATGDWIVEYTEDDKIKSDVFNAVLLATGHHRAPHYPQKWPNQDDFEGEIIHSNDYKHPTGFENKRAVIVGIGNSGVDIAVELSRCCDEVYLSTRRGAWLFGRVFDYGMPLDIANATRFRHGVFHNSLFPRWLRSWAVQAKMNQRFDHEMYGLKPTHDVFASHITINDDLPNRIMSGTVVIKPNIDHFTKTGIVFSDGTSVENVDTVVLCTGFDIEFPLVEHGDYIKVQNNDVNLYKYMYPPDKAHQTLAVLGLIQPLGSIMPISEMQARVFYSFLTEPSTIPSANEMRNDIERQKEHMRETFYASNRHTIQVDYITFMDELADLIGCKANLTTLLLSDPQLWYHVMFGPCAPYVYRITGPHAWNGARQALIDLQQRVLAGIRPALAATKRN